MRRFIFVGAHATRERKAFREFLKKNFPDKLRNIDEKISEMIFNDKKNVRTAKILQKLFIEIYEFYIKGNEKLEEELVETIRIAYDKKKKKANEVLSELIETLKNIERLKEEKEKEKEERKKERQKEKEKNAKR